MARQYVTIDGNEAAAYVAHKTAEVIVIYPITPSSPMGEHADEWSSWGSTNIWGTVPTVVEMQSEAGAAGAVHGALQTGSLSTTFTASQGLLLMIPNMYKIAGELTSTVFHIAARTVATHALSIFGDHSDVMAARSTGWAMLFANSVQEVMDFALISQTATLKARVPFLHVFDGFRTSHEVAKIERLDDDDIRALIDDDLVRAHRARGLSPDRPFTRGTAQNPDVFFQSREAANPFYASVPGIVEDTMEQFAAQVGRQYRPFDYVGAPDAERVLVAMGSACETAHEAVEYLAGRGERVGLVKVRLFRPFSAAHFVEALPATCEALAVLDRTKEPGALGEPLYQDVVTALAEGAEPSRAIRVIGGRYGLSSKEFTPEMVQSALEELKRDKPKNHFTVGIMDDVSGTSLDHSRPLDSESPGVVRAVFWGLGSDGTVGANKNSIKIIGETTDYHAQGYFVYDSKKAGAHTVSHLRFGPEPIRSTYLIRQADFVGVHQFGFLERFRVLDTARPGATLLLNAPYEKDEVWDHIPRAVQEQIIEKQLEVYAINGYRVARDMGMGNRINTIMQTCFFAITDILLTDRAIEEIKKTIRDTYGKRGEAVVQRNFAAVDAALEHLHRLDVPERATGTIEVPPAVPEDAPAFVREVTGRIMAGDGDRLPVSAMPVDGTFPNGTTRWEKRNLALEVPVWLPHVCIQCGRCVMYCPHAVIRSKVYDPALLEGAPPAFKSVEARWREPALKGMRYTVQVAVEDCTGCAVCVEVCPARDKTAVGRKAINMEPQLPIREQERQNWAFFLSLPDLPRDVGLRFTNTRNVQLLRPLFEFHSACAGCGETPYLRLLSQLFGDRALIANATGCSSIYSANLPGTAWSYDAEGRGPAWSNSLFEDNAEFGFGFRLTLDKQNEYARELLGQLRGEVGEDLVQAILDADQSDEAGVRAQRERVSRLRQVLEGHRDSRARELLSVAGSLVRRSVWAVGGDGWAYDIGYGGLDHVLAAGRDVNLLVLDTEVYSNTGGQASKATGLGAVAKFAASGKPLPKKDLGMMAMNYGYVYVAQVAMGADDRQTIQAFLEAESYPGPSLIIAYSTCIAHGINMAQGMDQEKLAVASGHWPLYRYDPRRRDEGLNPLQLDSRAPSIPLQDYIYNENRYRMLVRSDPDQAARLLARAQRAVLERWRKYEHLAAMSFDLGAEAGALEKSDETAGLDGVE
ncbi:MAG: pyruvate:ferredoxin (flavodoxin) oxidoreductase [Anaerolineae bacterium]|nr:pyruvate:ferredoxin (flavodoxin) oxidoreductase [Anaerolineae bacterium]